MSLHKPHSSVFDLMDYKTENKNILCNFMWEAEMLLKSCMRTIVF